MSLSKITAALLPYFINYLTTGIAWVGAGSEVANPKATDLCLEAQEHILARSLLDMGTHLLLTSQSCVPTQTPSFFFLSLPVQRFYLLTWMGSWAYNYAFADLECIFRHLQPRHQGWIYEPSSLMTDQLCTSKSCIITPEPLWQNICWYGKVSDVGSPLTFGEGASTRALATIIWDLNIIGRTF